MTWTLASPENRREAVMNRQFVTMQVGAQTIAAPVEDVREILDVRQVSPIPGTGSSALGMIDVRGENVAVLDLRALLSMEPIDDTERTRIVVFASGRGTVPTGLRTDAVIQVAALDDENLQLPPALASDAGNFIEGVGRIGGEFVTVLDFEALMAKGSGALS
jgi:purine-binding chemotaxis protein CheW